MAEGGYQIVLVEDTLSDVFLIREALEQAGLRFELQVLENGEKPWSSWLKSNATHLRLFQA
jgi:hypothetical protein